MSRGNYTFQASAILAKVAENKKAGCRVKGCRGNCVGYITTMQAHELAFCPTARFDGMRKRGWVIECQSTADKNSMFHFVRYNAEQIELLREERHIYLGTLPSGVELHVVAA